MKMTPPGKEPDCIYAVILNYKNYHDTIECIDALLKSSYKNLKIVVVDNGSENDSLNHIINWLTTIEVSLLYFEDVYEKFGQGDNFLESNARIILIQSEENNGFAIGNNIALSK